MIELTMTKQSQAGGLSPEIKQKLPELFFAYVQDAERGRVAELVDTRRLASHHHEGMDWYSEKECYDKLAWSAYGGSVRYKDLFQFDRQQIHNGITIAYNLNESSWDDMLNTGRLRIPMFQKAYAGLAHMSGRGRIAIVLGAIWEGKTIAGDWRPVSNRIEFPLETGW